MLLFLAYYAYPIVLMLSFDKALDEDEESTTSKLIAMAVLNHASFMLLLFVLLVPPFLLFVGHNALSAARLI